MRPTAGNQRRIPKSAEETRASRATTRPLKRSFAIAGHRTSISLEAAFWEALKAAAAEERTSTAKLIARIDAMRNGGGLSSTVRVWLLEHYRQGSRRGRT